MKPTQDQAEAAVRTLIAWAGDDPDRDGMRETPARVAKAFGEWFGGYQINPVDLLKKDFDESADEMIIETGINFTSHCEHHMAPITGSVSIGYIPRGRVVGISKFARVVDALAHRFQIQERLTRQIAESIQEALGPIGVGVIVTASHGCMTSRGCRQPGTRLVTSALLGVFREPAVRSEFIALSRLTQ